jgi:DNA repair protein RecN (Recombination protein N)
MLKRLQVRNYAIVDAIEAEFDAGMTVVTGETGAGKSLLVDALGLVLGERGGGGLVRPGSGRAEFGAEFDIAALPRARAWLTEQALDADGECLLRRVVGEDGRSRAFINGNAVPLQSLKALGEMLLDIHGQHFHQSLGRRDVQRDLLDHFGGLQARRAATEEAHASWRALRERLRQLQEREANRESRIELLSFQTRELETLDLAEGEYPALAAERQKLKMSAQLVEGLAQAQAAVSDGEAANAQNLLAEACRALDALAGIDPELEPVHALLDEASIQVGEAADALHRYGDSLELDAGRREWVEERLDAIRAVARKHRVEPDELGSLQTRLAQELAELSDAEAAGAQLAQEAEAARAAWLDKASELSDARKKAAKKLAARVTDAMQGLGMPGGAFEVAIERRGEDDARAHGLDDIEYLISANPGQAPMPLAKVASGGELSRMSLAIQVRLSDGSAIPTMVFDEVDAGVGGGVAEMVGRRLKDLAVTRQVFCVTHLPQLASLADHHFRIAKLTDGKATRTTIARLGEDERVEELARMLGGMKITARTREHAAEMLRNGSVARKGGVAG